MALRLNGATSGYSELDAPAVAGSNKLTLPTSNGSANQFLKNGGTAGTLGWSSLVEDSSGRLLVGTSSIAGAASNSLIIAKGTSHTIGTGRGQLSVVTSNTQAADIGGSILLGGQSTDADWPYASISGRSENNSYAGYFAIATSTSNGVHAERMRIKSTGETVVFSSGDSIYALTSAGAGTTTALYYGLYGASSTTTVGTTAYRVWSNGNVQNANNSYAGFSDIKLKENIVDASSQWDDIKALRVRKYNFKEGQTHTQIGVIAQEVELISPGLISESPDRDTEGNDLGTVTKSVNYSVLYMKAVKALQEAMERIETLEAANADLAARLSVLEAN